MVQREQDSMNKSFMRALMREQVIEEASNLEEIQVEVQEKPQLEEESFLSTLASRIVEEATAVTPKHMASDVLTRAGIDTRQFTGIPQVSSGHLRHVGKRAKKIAITQNGVRVKRVVKRPNDRPAVGSENQPRRRARKINR